jgi:RNA polymerase sigma-70 factor (ECF subfamily)
MRPSRQRSGIAHHRSSRGKGEDNVLDCACSACPQAPSLDEACDQGRSRGRGSTKSSAAWHERARWVEQQICPHEADLRRWLQRKLPCPTLVDDVIQDVYLRLTKTASVDHIESPKGYLWQTAHSVMSQRLRPGRSVAAEAVEDEVLALVPCPVPLPCEQVASRQSLELVFGLLDKLPATTRRVLMLRRVDGLSLKATAAAIGLSESAVEKHQLRGHRFLVEQVAELEA